MIARSGSSGVSRGAGVPPRHFEMEVAAVPTTAGSSPIDARASTSDGRLPGFSRISAFLIGEDETTW
jgi:hypothetical protein